MPIKCTARGSGPVDEAFAKVDDNQVQFFLIKFPVGSGTFKRNKFIYVHFVGATCGIVKRAKWNNELPNALKAFQTNIGIEEGNKAELTFDKLVLKLQKAFVSDSGEFSLASIKEEYNKRLEEEKAKMKKEEEEESAFEEGDEAPGSPVRARKTATELGLTAEQVIKAVHEDLSPFNWGTFEPNAKEAKLCEAGSNGVFELLEHLPDDAIRFGIVRMAFGTGRFRRSKCIFFQWQGDKVGAVSKGKANAVEQDMKDKVLGPCSAGIHMYGGNDKSLAKILEKVEKVFVVDHIKMESKEAPKQPMSQEAYVEALLEEQRAASSFYGEPEDMETPNSPGMKSPKKDKPQEFDIAETVKLIHQSEGGLTWCLVQAV